MLRKIANRLLVAGLLFGAATVSAQEVTTVTQGKTWPQACYNETSMWKTEACKDYITTVYHAAPASVFGFGMTGLLLLAGAAGVAVFTLRKRKLDVHH